MVQLGFSFVIVTVNTERIESTNMAICFVNLLSHLQTDCFLLTTFLIIQESSVIFNSKLQVLNISCSRSSRKCSAQTTLNMHISGIRPYPELGTGSNRVRFHPGTGYGGGGSILSHNLSIHKILK